MVSGNRCLLSHARQATEQELSQIEKEALVLTWGCEHFAEYLFLGMEFKLEIESTDHKHLIATQILPFASKDIGCA